MRKTLSLAGFKRELKRRGFYYQKSDNSWRSDNGSCTSAEAVESICEFWNGLLQWWILDNYRSYKNVIFTLSPDLDVSQVTMHDAKTGKVKKFARFKTSDIRRKLK